MIGIIEFKKETHERHKELARKAKEVICELYESIHGEGFENRIPENEFDERRGRSNMRMGQSGNRGGQGGYRGDYRTGYRQDMPYGFPPMYPYPFPGMDGQSQFEGRFTE